MGDPLYGWQVRLTAASSRAAKELVEQLRAEHLDCSRSFNEVFVSADGEARAHALAVRLERLEAVESAQAQLVGTLGGT